MNKKTGILGLSWGLKESSNKGELDIENRDRSIYYMPAEDKEHEGTWLQWPHSYTYGKAYQNRIEEIWGKMTRYLSSGENVHIIAYNDKEKNRIEKLLEKENIDVRNIDFYIYENDDVWVRDNGPIFVYHEKNKLTILDWGFNGWGKREPYKKSDKIPSKISSDLGIRSINLNGIVLEGGAMELDGKGTFLATKSSIINKNRNKDLNQSEIEEYIRQYYGVEKFIWLDGVVGLEITDFHIDGFVKFYNQSKVITLDKEGLRDWGVSEKDIKVLLNLTNANQEKYDYIYLPLTKNNVKLKNGKNLGYKGSYLNFYIGNKAILVPNYNDSNDEIANEIIQKLYPDREVIGIDIRELYKDGIHCVTQQQPIELRENKC